MFEYICLGLFLLMLGVIISIVSAMLKSDGLGEAAEQNSRKEKDPTYDLISVEYNPSTRYAKLHIRKNTEYRTIVRYIQRNYVKYPVLSEWKVRTRKIDKRVKLTNENLEKLRRNPEFLVSMFATDIITRIGREELFPSWYLKDRYLRQRVDKEMRINERITKQKQEFSEYQKSVEAEIRRLNDSKVIPLSKLEKAERKIRRYTQKSESSDFRGLEKRLQKYRGIQAKLQTQISDIDTSIQAKQDEAKQRTEDFQASDESLKKDLELIRQEYEDKVRNITPLPFETADATPSVSKTPERSYSNTTSTKSTTATTGTTRYDARRIFGEDYWAYVGWENDTPEQREDRIRRYKIYKFWNTANQHVRKYIETYDIDTLKEFIYNIWNTRDKKESAKDLHDLLELTVDELYLIRDHNNGYREDLIELCYLDLSNAENYTNVANGLCRWKTPTRLAVLLEKEKRYQEAIELCDFCIANKIIDRGYPSFLKRKEHLLKKAPGLDLQNYKMDL